MGKYVTVTTVYTTMVTCTNIKSQNDTFSLTSVVRVSIKIPIKDPRLLKI